MEKEKVKEIWELLSKITFELNQIEVTHSDIEILEEWMQNANICVTFSAEGWQGGEFCPCLPTSDFVDIAKMSTEVMHKRIRQRNAEALKYVKEMQEMLTEVEEEANE